VRQLGCRGSQPSSRFAFAFEAPRIPAMKAASGEAASANAGGIAPAAAAKASSHSVIGAGSSSTTL
jgi:hypothetical protein